MSDQDREHIRLKMDTKVFIEVTAAGPDDTGAANLLQCDVVDVSFGGLRINIDEELIEGSILSICVELPTFDDLFYMAGEVMWCRPNVDEAGGAWAVGFKLLTSSDSDINSWRELLNHV